MYDIIIYKVITNPCMRIVCKTDGTIWDNVAGALATAPTYANTAISLTRSTSINGIPITMPTTLPKNKLYNMLIYDAASPADTDSVSVGKSIYWNSFAEQWIFSD